MRVEILRYILNHIQPPFDLRLIFEFGRIEVERVPVGDVEDDDDLVADHCFIIRHYRVPGWNLLEDRLELDEVWQSRVS